MSDLLLEEQATPSTPSSGQGLVYFKSDGLLYTKDDAGNESLVGGYGGWQSYTPTISADTGSFGTLTVTTARFVQFGKTVHIRWQLAASVTGGSPTEARITLPSGLTGHADGGYTVFWGNNNGTGVAMLCRHINDTRVNFQTASGAAFAGSCSWTGATVIELA